MNHVILSYLSELERNNNREWYHSHKKEYQEAHKEFEMLIEQLLFEIGKKDSSILHNTAKDLTFKLVRDTRYSKDKSPYNPNFRCHIASAGKMPIPVGYFLSIRPNNQSFLGGGLFTDIFKDATTLIRDYINTHNEEFQTIIKTPEFADFFQVQGITLKKVPTEYSADYAQAEFLKFKSWYLEYPFENALLEDTEQFILHASNIFLKMKPFNDYLNRALESFVMPERKTKSRRVAL